MDRLQPVSRIMTRDVESVQLSESLSAVYKLLAARPFHHMPVLKGEVLVGVISIADVAPLTLGAYVSDAETVYAHLDARHSVLEVMTPEPTSVTPATSIREAAELLAEGSFHALPVVDGRGHLQGILTSTDLIRWLLTL